MKKQMYNLIELHSGMKGICRYDVDAEIRKAKHALWAHRAMIAKRLKESFGIRALYNPLLCSEEHKWEIVERKCRAKVKEYE